MQQQPYRISRRRFRLMYLFLIPFIILQLIAVFRNSWGLFGAAWVFAAAAIIAAWGTNTCSACRRPLRGCIPFGVSVNGGTVYCPRCGAQLQVS